ncbi:hypothetical protein ABB37_08175 [Leptomonas pyrrhocoris]|uniref:Uncharacterized protein n=1 Tax=Leptomonas pyrrhocoris TaxID=157538 RepID=A0A0M9FU25_LEPPY|nr:hypothetical protein ABB37_08175 [Leptomonas pyrrhocoris]KPA76033.1 hypothetical protein ABB37_08175 [Leptomonas pyrrhocoris]|eukprot:XP_015654472.1 hypothetical protein ABB37_08175 [Leptomonas pyrrhocoris]
MYGNAATAGLGPTSSSQHAASKSAHLRAPSAGKRSASAGAWRRAASPLAASSTSPVSALPARRRSAAGADGRGSHVRNAGAGGGGGSNTRPPTRPASVDPTRLADDSSNSNPVSGHDVAYLYQQLQDALHQQTHIEDERQRQLGQYRRQLRAYCNDNATLRNIILAGESRKRDAAASVSDEVCVTGARAHSAGTRNGPSSVTAAELEVVEERIHLARKRHNRLMHEVRVNTAALENETELRTSITEEAGAPLDPASLLMGANRPVYLRLLRLEHLLNEVLRKQSTVGVVLKNYRYHLATLREEATQYDVQQHMLENEYADRHRDHLQLLELYDTARAAYSSTVEARVALQQSGAKMRRAKEKALQQKRKEVEKELAATQVQERRAVDLQLQLEEEAQLLEAAENTKAQLEKQRWNLRAALTLLKTTNTSRDGAEGDAAGGGDGEMEDDVADERLSAFEAAFRDMMQVAHADTLDQLVDIYTAEMEQQCKLQDDLDNLRETRRVLQQETRMLQERQKQTRYCVGAGTHHGAASGQDASSSSQSEAWRGTAAGSPLMEREMETFLREEKDALSAQISANAQNQSLLREVAERMNRLAALVADYRADVRLPEIRASPALARRSSTLPLHSVVLAQKLLALASDATSHNAFITTATAAAASSAAHSAIQDDGVDSGAVPVVSSTQLVIPANNRRVPLAHERGGGGDNSGGAAGPTRPAADVAGISSMAARALLNATEHPVTSLAGSPQKHMRGAAAGSGEGFKRQRKRRSSAHAGAGFIEGLEEDDDDDEVQLATVAALPPPGGRVLDFDLDSLNDTDGGAVSESSSVPARHGNTIDGGDAAAAAAEGDGETRATAMAQRRRRSSAMANLAGPSGGSARGAIAAAVAEDDQDDPLRREEVKKMSEVLQERRKRDAEAEAEAAAAAQK